MQKSHYIIRGGIEGRERLRILSRVMQATSLSLLQRAGIQRGMNCLEIGCGGGDLAFEIARLVGDSGSVVATDIDGVKLELAREEAKALQLSSIEFRLADIAKDALEQTFDLVHARFVLTHLPDPLAALTRMRQALRPGGVAVVEDIDFRGYFCHPDSPALWRYVDLYTRTVQRKGGDANIGPRLPSLLREAGFENVQVNVVQLAGLTGEVKLLAPITMESIADAVISEGFADQAEIDRVVDELYAYAHDPGTIGCIPRVVESWGCTG